MIKKLSILVAAVFMLSLGAVACGDDDDKGGNNNGGSGGTVNPGGNGGNDGGTGGNDGGTGGNDGGTNGNDGGTGGNDGGTDGNDGGTGGTDVGNTGGTGGDEGEEPVVDSTCEEYCTHIIACGVDFEGEEPSAECVTQCEDEDSGVAGEVRDCVINAGCGDAEAGGIEDVITSCNPA